MSVREREDASNSHISPVPVSELVDDRTGGTCGKTKPTEYQSLKKGPRSNGETCVTILRFRNGCKNLGRIWWMMKFHYREALTPVLLMKPLWSRLQRDVRIWASTMFILISLKTEIARFVNGPKLQGHRAEDAMAKPRRIRAKTKVHKKPREACKSSWNPRGNQKSITLTIP